MFKKAKDQKLMELNSKYHHPRDIRNYYYIMKKPGFRKYNALNCDESPAKSAKNQYKTQSPEKDQNEGEQAIPLSFKEKFKLLDDSRKKIFFKYFRWKHGLYNENNLKHENQKLIMKYDPEY